MTTMLLAKINIVDNIFLLILGTVFCVFGYWFLWGKYKRLSKNQDYSYDDYVDLDEYGILVLVGGVFALIGAIVVCGAGSGITKWIIVALN